MTSSSLGSKTASSIGPKLARLPVVVNTMPPGLSRTTVFETRIFVAPDALSRIPQFTHY
jgi:hypothetical protein